MQPVGFALICIERMSDPFISQEFREHTAFIQHSAPYREGPEDRIPLLSYYFLCNLPDRLIINEMRTEVAGSSLCDRFKCLPVWQSGFHQSVIATHSSHPSAEIFITHWLLLLFNLSDSNSHVFGLMAVSLLFITSEPYDIEKVAFTNYQTMWCTYQWQPTATNIDCMFIPRLLKSLSDPPCHCNTILSAS